MYKRPVFIFIIIIYHVDIIIMSVTLPSVIKPVFFFIFLTLAYSVLETYKMIYSYFVH